VADSKNRPLRIQRQRRLANRNSLSGHWPQVRPEGRYVSPDIRRCQAQTPPRTRLGSSVSGDPKAPNGAWPGMAVAGLPRSPASLLAGDEKKPRASREGRTAIPVASFRESSIVFAGWKESFQNAENPERAENESSTLSGLPAVRTPNPGARSSSGFRRDLSVSPIPLRGHPRSGKVQVTGGRLRSQADRLSSFRVPFRVFAFSSCVEQHPCH